MNKKELLKALLKDELINKETYIFSMEYHKVNDKIGFFKLDILDSTHTTIFKFKIQMDAAKEENSKHFALLKDGEDSIDVGLLQLENKSLLKKIKEGISDSLGEGRVPFISGLLK